MQVMVVACLQRCLNLHYMVQHLQYIILQLTLTSSRQLRGIQLVISFTTGWNFWYKFVSAWVSSHDKVLLTFLPGVAESSHSRGKFAANSMVEKVMTGTGGHLGSNQICDLCFLETL